MEDLIFLGNTRPQWPLDCIGKGYVMCQCSQILQTIDAVYGHWKLGHFDTPVYCSKEEMINRKLKEQDAQSK